MALQVYILFSLQMQTGALVVTLLVFPTICVAHGSQLIKALGRLREHEHHACSALIHLAATNPYSLPAASIPGSLQLDLQWPGGVGGAGAGGAGATPRRAQELHEWVDSGGRAAGGQQLPLAEAVLNTRAEGMPVDAPAATRAAGGAVNALPDLPGGEAEDSAAAARRWSSGTAAASGGSRWLGGSVGLPEPLQAPAPPRPGSAQLSAALQELVGNDVSREALMEDVGGGWLGAHRRGVEGWASQQGAGARSGLWARLEELLADTGRPEASPATPRMANLLEDVRQRDQHTNEALVRSPSSASAPCCCALHVLVGLISARREVDTPMPDA